MDGLRGLRVLPAIAQGSVMVLAGLMARDMGIHNAYITGDSPEAIALCGSLDARDEVSSSLYELPV
jgi:hypothetical protein